MNRKTKLIKRIVIVILSIVVLYLIAVYSEIPFIKKWRTIYIETAMSTMTHQWLATSFIPKSVVDKVMADNEVIQQENMVDENTVEKIWHSKIWIGHPIGLSEEQKAEKTFIETYTEIDLSTLPEDVVYKDLWIKEPDGVKTIQGDDVYLIDTLNGILIVNISGSGYVGKLCIIKDPSKVSLGTTSAKNSGQYIYEISEENNGILAINASGFVDPGGNGNGGQPVGLVVSHDELLQKQITGGYWFNAGLDFQNNLRIGSKIEVDTLRDAVQFKPAIIIDGEKKVRGSAGWGIQPRTVIAQNARKDIIFLVIDGRKPGYSIGTTVGECADILERYDVTQAINLDGGASTVLVYNGETINVPCTRNINGRRAPNAWVVSKTKDIEQ